MRINILIMHNRLDLVSRRGVCLWSLFYCVFESRVPEAMQVSELRLLYEAMCL